MREAATIVLAHDVYPDGEALPRWFARPIHGVDSDLEIPRVAQVVTARRDYAGEVVVQALAGEGPSQVLLNQQGRLRWADQVHWGAPIVIDRLKLRTSACSLAELHPEVLARR